MSINIYIYICICCSAIIIDDAMKQSHFCMVVEVQNLENRIVTISWVCAELGLYRGLRGFRPHGVGTDFFILEGLQHLLLLVQEPICNTFFGIGLFEELTSKILAGIWHAKTIKHRLWIPKSTKAGRKGIPGVSLSSPSYRCINLTQPWYLV